MRISELEHQIKACRLDLVSISETLRIFGDPEAYVKPEAMFGRGDLSRTIFGSLRTSLDGLDTRQLAEIVMTANEFDINDAKLTATVRNRVNNAMYRYLNKGEVINRKMADGTRVWRIAP
ncbi:MAG: hypothetical protein ACLPPF_16550 [Rhodomicrobium sp.]